MSPVDRSAEPKTAVQMWRRRIAKSAGRVAFRHKQGEAWRPTTWGEADTQAREVAAGLTALGIAPGDRVCLVSQTRPEWIVADVGILLAGAITVPIYASSTAEQCEFIIKDSGAKVVIVEDASQVAKLLPLRARLGGVIRLVDIAGDATGAPDYVQSFTALRDAGRSWLAAHVGELDKRGETIDPQQTFTIIYTSGTTGNPKGVVLTHENLTAGVCSAIRAMTLFETDEQYLFLPLAHVLARELEWAAIEAGVVTSFCSAGNARIKDDLGEVRPTFMAGVPRVFEKFYAAVQAGTKQGSAIKKGLVGWAFRVGKEVSATTRAGKPLAGFLAVQHGLADKLVLGKLRAKLGLDRCRFLISGGAPLAAEIADFFHSAGLLILEGYGLTETVAAAFLNQIGRFRFGSVGPALDVIECKIIEDGEILMRGPSVFRQYYNNAAATDESVEADGWFHTGDIGLIEDGFLRITDRKKDLIVTSGGKKIAPQPLENALKMRSPLISQVVVYGDKRPYCVALVTLSEEAIRRFGGADLPKLAASDEVKRALQQDVDALNATLASYESIKRFAILSTDFTEASGELTPSMKVKRKIVVDRYSKDIEGLYS